MARLLLGVRALIAVSFSLQAQQGPVDNQGSATNSVPAVPHVGRMMSMDGKENEMRERLGQLATLSDDQLKAELTKWPRYQHMSLGEQSKFLAKLQEIRDRQKAMAAAKARELGLNLSPEQKTAFESSYLQKRMAMERQLWKEMEPRRRQLESQISQDLMKEFGTSASNPPSSVDSSSTKP